MAEVSIMHSGTRDSTGNSVTGDRPGDRVLARSVERRGTVTVVGGSGGPARRRSFRAEPDVASARRWLRTLRRIDRVEIDGSPTPRSLAHAVGHRRPVVRPVPLATALGLAVLGVPLLIELDIERDQD